MERCPTAESCKFPGVDDEVLAELRRVGLYYRAFASVGTKLTLWEAFSLSVRNPGVSTGRPPVDELIDLRMKKGPLARRLRRLVAGLPIGKYSYDTMELTYAFILASPEGCSRTLQWTEAPDQFRREAAIRVEGVISHAEKYLAALRSRR